MATDKRWSRWRSAAWPVLLATLWMAPAQAEAASPEKLLREQKRLSALGGQTWVPRLELAVRQRLAKLADLESSILAARRDLDGRVAENRRLWQTQQARVRQLRKALESLSSNDPDRRRLKIQLASLRARAVNPTELGGHPEVQARLIGLINHGNELTVSLTWIRQRCRELVDDYARLQADPDIVAALAQLGPKHRLGPDKEYTKQLARYERVAFTGWTPLYRQSEQLRFSALVDEQTPITFSWCDDSGPTVLTAGMAEAAGLQLGGDAFQNYRAGKRQFRVLRAVIPQLRIGRYLFRNVECLVLPPEGEDLGARLGRRALGPLRAEAEPERLRLTLLPEP